MNIKNFNLFEQHVEKIALTLAVAGAGWMIWMSLQPITIPDAAGKPMEVADVEHQVDAAVNRLEVAKKATAERTALNPNVPNYDRAYKQKIDQPLDNALVSAAAVPAFIPHQAPVVQRNLTPSKVGTGLVITPTVPPPGDLSAVSWRGTVLKPGEAPPTPAAAALSPTGGPPPVAPANSMDQDLVVIEGSLGLAEFTISMANVQPIEQRLTGVAQRTIVYRVEAQRRALPGSSKVWTAWENVPAASSPPAPADVPPVSLADLEKNKNDIDPTLTVLKGSQNKITEPDSYLTPEGKPVLKLLLKSDAAALVADPTVPAAPAPPATAPAPGAVPTTPVWIVDDHVEPGTEYQYRVRLVMFNPTFNWMIEGQPGRLADPTMMDKPVIESAWAMVPNSVVVKGNVYFFVNGPIGGGAAGQQAISAQVYKWVNGHWYVDRNAPAQPGAPITGGILLPPPDRKRIDVPTGYTVVDVSPVTIQNRDEVEVVLLAPTGELVTRNSRDDRNDDQHKQIDAEVQRLIVLPPKPPTPPPPTPPKPPVNPVPSRPPVPPGGGVIPPNR